MKPSFKDSDKYLFGAGWALLAIGTVTKALDFRQDVLGLVLGIGCGFILVGTVSMFIKTRNPRYAKQQAIEQSDERNVQIRGRAGYSTFFLTTFLLAALEIALLILEYYTASLLAAFVLLAHAAGYFIAAYYHSKKL